MVTFGPLGEQLGVVIVGHWDLHFPVWYLLLQDIDVVETPLPPHRWPEIYHSLNFCMNGVVLSYNSIVPRMPFVASLSCYDVARINLLSPKSFET